MKNKFKHFIAVLMIAVTAMGNFQFVFAKEKTYGFMQVEEIFLASSHEYEQNTRSAEPEIVTTYKETGNGSYEIFSYRGGELFEIVECGNKQEYIIVKEVTNGEVSNENRIAVEVNRKQMPMSRASKNIGIIFYENSLSGNKLSISVPREDQSGENTVRINTGKYTLAQIAGMLLTA